MYLKVFEMALSQFSKDYPTLNSKQYFEILFLESL